MANVLNKLLTICENLDTKGGSAGGSTSGSSGSVSIDGGTHIGKLACEFDINGLNEELGTSYLYILLGKYDDEAVKDLTVMYQLVDTNELAQGINMFKINTNKDINSMIQYNLLSISDMTTTIGNVETSLCSITLEGIKFLALKLTNSTLKTDNFIMFHVYVIGTDYFDKNDDMYKYIMIEKDQTSSLNEIDLTRISAEKPYFGGLIQGSIN